MDFLNGSFRIGQLFGINVRVHVLFVIWAVFELLSSPGDWRMHGMFLGLLFGIVLLHEFGHCFGARAVGGDARDILMWPLGGLAYAHAPMRPWPQFVTVAAGPLVNVVLCLVSAAILIVHEQTADLFSWNPLIGVRYWFEEPWLNVVATFYRVNLFLLAFNLLPIYPLDGGQIFHAILWPFVGLQRATLIACYVGLAGCLALGLWGLRPDNRMLLFIAFFGGFTCWQRLRMAQMGLLVEDERFTAYDPIARPRRLGWLRRLFRSGGGPRPRRPLEYPTPNPNPGGWEARLEEEQRLEVELDRILKKVSAQGIQSLTYVERQTLERATRARQAREDSARPR